MNKLTHCQEETHGECMQLREAVSYDPKDLQDLQELDLALNSSKLLQKQL